MYVLCVCVCVCVRACVCGCLSLFVEGVCMSVPLSTAFISLDIVQLPRAEGMLLYGLVTDLRTDSSKFLVA